MEERTQEEPFDYAQDSLHEETAASMMTEWPSRSYK
jgi:hypothetical protein